MLTKAAHHCA
ncbi:hypothetical protein D018_1190A, partial [Vibrio parahaemolyticus VP2007-007]